MRKLVTALAGLLACSATAAAADLPVKAAPVPVQALYNWSGYYIGGHVGYAWVDPDLSAASRALISATYGGVPKPSGIAGGLHAGFDSQMPNNWVLGIGLDVNGFGIDGVSNRVSLGAANLKATVDWDIAIYGRVGYAYNTMLLYALAGIAFDHNKVSGAFVGAAPVPVSIQNWHVGPTVGAGVEVPLVDRWSARLQYRFTWVGKQSYGCCQIGATGSLIDLGLTKRF